MSTNHFCHFSTKGACLISQTYRTLNRKLLITYGSDLDHSNMDYLVRTLLVPYEGQMFQNDYDNPVLRKGADFILNLETLETNLNKPFETYVFADYHLTQAQLDGFLYQLRKLKGKHVFGNPGVRGHREVFRGNQEFQFLVVHTEDQEAIFMYYRRQDLSTDCLVATLIPKLPPEERYIVLPLQTDLLIQQQKLEDWVDRLLSLR